MIIILFLWFLLLPGVGWGDELIGDPHQNWIYDQGGNYKYRCEGDPLRCEVWTSEIERFHKEECYQRMQEAMYLADRYFRENLITTAVRADDSKKNFLEVVPLWAEIVRDCVEGKP